MVIFSFAFTTLICFWVDWIPLFLTTSLSLQVTKAEITFFVWIFLQAQIAARSSLWRRALYWGNSEGAKWRKGDRCLRAVCRFHGWCTLQVGTASYSRVLSIPHRGFLAFLSANRKGTGGKGPSFPFMFSVRRGNTKHFCCFSTGFVVATKIWKGPVQAREFTSKFSFSPPSAPIIRWPKRACKHSYIAKQNNTVYMHKCLSITTLVWWYWRGNL